jgi:hypothetical protein
MPTKQFCQPRQLPLDAAMEEELVLRQARVMFTSSKLLSGRYASFEKAMADPVQGRCLRLCATQLLRLGKRTRG